MSHAFTFITYENQLTGKKAMIRYRAGKYAKKRWCISYYLSEGYSGRWLGCSTCGYVYTKKRAVELVEEWIEEE